jgi:hypothetical protein
MLRSASSSPGTIGRWQDEIIGWHNDDGAALASRGVGGENQLGQQFRRLIREAREAHGTVGIFAARKAT